MVLFAEYGAVCLSKNGKILMCFEGENNLKSGFLATKIHF